MTTVPTRELRRLGCDIDVGKPTTQSDFSELLKLLYEIFMVGAGATA